MTKKLNEDDIVNELKGQSAFFRQATPLPVQEQSPTESRSQSQSVEKGTISAPVASLQRRKHASAGESTSFVPEPSLGTVAPLKLSDTNIPNKQLDASTLASNQASLLASYHASIIDVIRKTVKGVGKEVTFVRLTPEEKNQLSDIVYTYKRQGIKTSENEISRIAINFLLEEYKTNGETSILARVLASLLA